MPQESEPTLLVVDDQEINRLILERRFSQAGYRVHCAAGGREAIELLDHHHVDLVLLDVMMPEVSGLDVLRTVRQRRSPADLPVIMVTARDASEDVVQALELGANDYITKPVDLAIAMARVATQLSLKRAKEDVEALNRRLQRAQERIDELSDSAEQALDDVAAWAATMAPRVAEAVEADAVTVVLFGTDEAPLPSSLAEQPDLAADLARLRGSASPPVREGRILVPVRGIATAPYGALVVVGRAERFGRPDRRLLESFARQLGTAVEMRELRSRLEQTAARRRLVQSEMLASGVDLLRLCPRCDRCYDQRTEQCPEDQSTLEAPVAFPYRLSDRYRLVRVQGEGGMGTVYEAFDERLTRSVAVKAIKPEYYDDPAAQRRFAFEAQAVIRIDHPSVVSIYDSGKLDDGTMFIVMEWLLGHDLADVLRRWGPGTPGEVALLVQQGSAGLAAAHDAGIVHRDIKPENVFLTAAAEGFRAKLLDFGIAKDVSGPLGLTQTNAIVGSPLYMAPEQLLQKPVDSRSDFYSFAAVVYQALTGRRVTVSNEFADVILDVVHTVPPPVSSLLPDVPPEVDHALVAALAKSPSARPACIRAWAGALAAALEGMPSKHRGWLAPNGGFRSERDDAALEPLSAATTKRIG